MRKIPVISLISAAAALSFLCAMATQTDDLDAARSPAMTIASSR